MSALKIILLNEKCIPEKKNIEDCWDLKANIPKLISIGQLSAEKIQLGVCIEVPKGYQGFIRTRSGHRKAGLSVEGTVDPGYTGEVCALVINHLNIPYHLQPLERICQFVLVKVDDNNGELEIVKEFPQSPRNDKGFGSSGLL